MKWRRALRAVVCCTLAVLIAPTSSAAPYRQGASRAALPAAPGQVSLQAPLALTFALKSSGEPDLDAYAAAVLDPNSPDYHRWLTPQEIGARFGATDADIRAVLDYIAGQGFTVRQVWPNRLYVTATATVAQAQKAFGIKMAALTRPRFDASVAALTYVAPDRAPQLPPEIAARVQSVLGLTDAFAPHPGLRRRSVRQEPPDDALAALTSGTALTIPPPGGVTPAFSGSIGPPQISKVYNLDAIHALGVNGQGMQIGVYSPTAFAQSDIDTFAAGYNITGYTVKIVSVNGGITSQANDIEACLDLEVILGQANNAQIVVYETPNDGNLDTWLKIQTDNLPVISDSWIADENYIYNYKDSNGQYTGRDYMDQFDRIAKMMTAQGMTVFNASGDNGAYNGHSGVLGINFPGCDPNITAVGGTTLSDTNGFWKSETGWSGSGGGLSAYFQRPAWQAGPGTDNRYSNGMRQTPDVAALADPFGPGYRFYWRGRWSGIGGTSGAAPLWASAYLLVNQGAAARPGNIGPLLYSLGTTLNDATNIFIFHDVTSGSNGFYTAAAKWDYVTGWGSADFGKLYADMLLQPFLHPFTPPSTDPNGVWTAPITVHTAAASVTEPTAFTDDTTYSFAASIRNDGPADAVPTVNSLQIDGVDHFFTMGAYAAGYYYVNLQAASAMLSAGTHTLTLVADANNRLKNFSPAVNTATRTIQVAAAPPLVSAVAVAPTRVSGGFIVSGTVTIEGPANAAGAVVQLQSSVPGAASVPATVTIPAGATTASFRIQTYRVPYTRTVTISAIRGAATKTALLTVSAGASAAPNPIGPAIPTLPHGPSQPRQ